MPAAEGRRGKISEMMLDFARPLLDVMGPPRTIDDLRKAFEIATVCWNLPTLEREQQAEAQALRQHFDTTVASFSRAPVLSPARPRRVEEDSLQASTVHGRGRDPRHIARRLHGVRRGPRFGWRSTGEGSLLAAARSSPGSTSAHNERCRRRTSIALRMRGPFRRQATVEDPN